jgi:hypothetical protein
MEIDLLDDQILVGRALAAATENLRAKGAAPEGRVVVMDVLQTVADIERRLEIVRRETLAPRSRRSAWPAYLHTYEERDEAAKQRIIDIALGGNPDAVIGLPIEVTDEEIATATAVNEIFPALLPERNRDRDWRVLKLLAVGEKSEREIAADAGMSPSGPAGVKRFKAAAIWSRARLFMSEPAVAFAA